jgi:ribosome-associated protein YbcJ (S4-like RNA binding protein)
MNNLHRVQSVLVSDGTALPVNNAAITTVASGDIGVFGTDWTALNPAGGDTITTQPSIYIVEGRLNSAGETVVKKSMKISGQDVVSYQGEAYRPTKRHVEAIGYNRESATGSIEVTASTDYNFRIVFKNDKTLHSLPAHESFSLSFTSSTSATQSSIATQAANLINNAPGLKTLVTAIVVGDGTGVYGVTGATNFGVEITSKEIEQFASTTYTQNQVYFGVYIDDNSGFGSTTTQTTIQTIDFGSGTYNQVYFMENKALGYEGVTNRRLWPIPVQTLAVSSTYKLSAAITPVATGTAGEDEVTFDLTIAAIIRVGEEVEIDGVNYKVKYIKGDGTGVGAANAVVLTSVLLTTPSGDAAKIRFKYDVVHIEFNSKINTPTGVVAIANQLVSIAVPAIDEGGAYNSTGTAATNLKAILDGWMTTTPGAFANISI